MVKQLYAEREDAMVRIELIRESIIDVIPPCKIKSGSLK
jgi:hypothetical protein